MSNESKITVRSTGGITFTGLLQITFIILKLCGVIDWSWFWVLSPLWGSIALAIIAIIIVVFIYRYLNK